MSAKEDCGYEMVIGLEVHAELNTETKIFCACPTAFGAEPNTQCCPVCAGMPGALPTLNGRAVERAVTAGLATHCAIAPVSKLDRKNYFYPDLPKAYQISQYDQPLCSGGYLDIALESGGHKRVGITRIHIEEDAGKLIHTPEGLLIDCNRCGVPLIEIVSEPDIRSAEEAKGYLQKLRAILLYAGVSDCKMNEGSLRCDVNLSVRRRGGTELGTRTEIKNLNSFGFIVRAIEYEFARQVRAVEAGEAIVQETRRFDAADGKTYAMRRKEDAHDYRYFPDPDLVPVAVDAALIERLRAAIPALPDERAALYAARWGLTPYAAEQLCAAREIADYFEAAAAGTDYPVLAANLILGEFFRLLPPDSTAIPVTPEHLAALAQLLGAGKVNSAAGRRVAAELWISDEDPRAVVERLGLWQISDAAALEPLARAAIDEQPKAAADYRRGRTAALQALVGQAMKKTRGRGDPVKLRELLVSLLDRGDGA